MSAGRFAPSPSGDLHVGNLRTAVLAWLLARATGRKFVLRIEDLDRARARDPRPQLEALRAIGLDWDGPVHVQSRHVARFDAAIDDLRRRGLVYECWCTRREIGRGGAGTARHPRPVPGHLPAPDRGAASRTPSRAARRPASTRGRRPARPSTTCCTGRGPGRSTTSLLRRADGTPAYNLAVVVDDAHEDVDQVVRGDDLLASAPRQMMIARLLGLPTPVYAHVPLVVDDQGRRLAKRGGAVTLPRLAARGVTPVAVLALLLHSLGGAVDQTAVDAAVDTGEPAALLAAAVASLELARLPRRPVDVPMRRATRPRRYAERRLRRGARSPREGAADVRSHPDPRGRRPGVRSRSDIIGPRSRPRHSAGRTHSPPRSTPSSRARSRILPSSSPSPRSPTRPSTTGATPALRPPGSSPGCTSSASPTRASWTPSTARRPCSAACPPGRRAPVLLYGHYDVQPPLDEAAWHTPPFTLTPGEGGRLHGRGAADCKGNLVAHLSALRALRATAGALPVGVRVVFEGSEEQGGQGLDRWLAEHPEDFAADVMLIMDSGNVAAGEPTLTVALRGVGDLTVAVDTVPVALHSGQFGGAAAGRAAGADHDARLAAWPRG
jgi:glutamyl-tRNA synthetase